jgi:hypothetical protein
MLGCVLHGGRNPAHGWRPPLRWAHRYLNIDDLCEYEKSARSQEV